MIFHYIFNNGTLSPVFNVLGIAQLIKDPGHKDSVPEYPDMYINGVRQYLSIDKDNYQLILLDDKQYNSKGNRQL